VEQKKTSQKLEEEDLEVILIVYLLVIHQQLNLNFLVLFINYLQEEFTLPVKVLLLLV
jgi:hypothetical protein